MRRLTLLRHAKSSWNDAGLADHDRPLAGRGLRDAPRMGERLARRGLAPGLLLTSSAVRARQTAELIAPAFEHTGLLTRVEPNLYLASPGTVLAILAGIEDDFDDVVLIGHNPTFTQLANRLLPSLGLDNLPTAGAVALECDAERWSALGATTFRLRFYDHPKNRSAPV